MTLRLLFCLSVLLISATGCYRAAGDGDFCTIPVTNNCGITRHADTWQPGMGY